jgi:raffinose/stachyose/melibiose transport system substrate-binding protein
MFLSDFHLSIASSTSYNRIQTGQLAEIMRGATEMNLNRKRIGALGLSICLAVGLAACGNSNEKTEGTGNDNATPKDEKITLTLITNNPKATADKGQGKAFYAALDKFRADNPNITIKDEGFGSEYGTKLKTLGAANELPDVFLLEGNVVANFSQNNLIKPINDVFDADPGLKDKYLPGAFSDVSIGDQIYGIPYKLSSTSMIFYNKEIFNEAGITEFPKTWDEFKEAVTKLKEKGYVPIAVGNKDKWLMQSSILSTLGDRFTGTDWTMSIKDRSGAKFTDPDFVNALKEIKALSEMKAFNTDLNSISNSDQRGLYYNKKAAMFFEGAWAISAVTNDAPKDVLDATEIAVIPSVSGGKGDPNAMSGGAAFGYTFNPNLTGAKRDAAIAVVKAVTGEYFAKLDLENNDFPAYIITDYDKSKIGVLTQKYLELVAKGNFVPVYDMKFNPDIIEAINNGVQNLTLKATPEEIAEKIQKVYDKGNK